MYVYLIGCKSKLSIHTYIGMTDKFEKRLKEHNAGSCWFPLLVLETSDKLATKIQNDWRSTVGIDKRIKDGFKHAKKYCLTMYVAEVEIGVLKQMPPGDVKVLGPDFWDSL